MVHVGKLVVQLPRNLCGAMNWSLVRAGECNEIVSCTFTHAGKRINHNPGKTDKLL